MLELAAKTHDEIRQGEAFAPYKNDPNEYHRKFYIESYGCQMNFSDSEIVASILNNEGFGATGNYEDADIVLLNTCSIREKAEQTVRKRLTEFRKIKEARPGMLIGMLGCMAERLKSKLLEEEKLLEKVALVNPELRVRFSTSHPKDITEEVLQTMVRCENICNYIHLPVQSGSTRILQLMNRTYTREWYMAKVNQIKRIILECGISSDIIAGFCTETEEDHKDTLSIMEHSKYDMSYMFIYSERPGTLAARRYKDDVLEEVKKRRLQEIVELQNRLSLESNKRDIGKTFEVLIEGDSKKSTSDWMGRNSQN